MGIIIDGNVGNRDYNLQSVDYKYSYPKGLDLNPNSDTHKNIVRMIMKKARDSYSIISARHKNWNKIDRNLTAYVPTSKLNSKGERVSTTPVIIPMSYATLETMLTYLMATFIREPIFLYEGTGPEDVIGTILMEKVVWYQCRHGKFPLRLHTLLRDGLAYGLGSGAISWERKMGKKVSSQAQGFMSLLSNKFTKTDTERNITDSVLFEGSVLQNIFPYAFLPDPNVSAGEINRSEYVGWIDRTNLMDALTEEEYNKDNTIFNCQYLKHINGKGSIVTDNRKLGNKKTNFEQTSVSTTNPIDRITMFMKIIPSEEGLGNSDYPEKWLFVLDGEQVITQARPLNLNHGMFPIVSCAPNFDGYNAVPISPIEIIYGLQDSIDWLFSSHMANVRKSINDMLVVDPSLLNMNDLKNPGPGKLVRLRRTAWGRGVNDSIKQLQVNDITRNNVADSSFIMDIAQRVTAASDQMQGIMRSGGERRSATESRDARLGALSRYEKMARIIGDQCMFDMSIMFAEHTQQFMEEDIWVKVVGKWEENLRKEYGSDIKSDRLKVSFKDMLVRYDIIPHDGSIPGGEPADLWIQLFQAMSSNQELTQEFDMTRIFKHVARQLGAKNLEDFAKKGGQMQPMIAADSQVQDNVQAGNLAPIEING